MEISQKIKLQPFRVPNFVLVKQEPGKREDGFKEGPKYALSELDEFALSMLCDKFREDVFKKAGKTDPDA